MDLTNNNKDDRIDERDLLIKVFALDNTPDDFLDNFTPFDINKTDLAIAKMNYHVSGSFSASVGENHTKENYDFEKKKHLFVFTYYKPKKKVETETLYTPICKDFSKKETVYLAIDEGNKIFQIDNIYDDSLLKKKDELKDFKLNEDMENDLLDFGKDQAIDQAESDALSILPSDVEDDEYDFEAELNDYSFYKAIKYDFTTSYKGKTIKGSYYSFDKKKVEVSGFDVKHIETSYEKNSKLNKILMLILGAIIIFGFGLANILVAIYDNKNLALSFIYSIFVMVLVLIVGMLIINFITRPKSIQKEVNDYMNKKMARAINKINMMNEYLSKNGLEPLSQDEKSLFN